MEAFESLSGYYNARDEHARFESKHGRVEFLTTVRYIDKYIVPGARVIEIGAGSGRYSHHYARKGYQVDAVELIPRNINAFNAHTLPGERVTILQGDARDLRAYPADAYDITLLLGPMYHLFTDDDRRAAISEAIRVTKPGGVIFAAYCNNDATMVQYCFVRGNIKKCMDAGMIDPLTFKCISEPKDVFALYTKREIDALMANFRVQRLNYIGADMATNFISDTVDAMDDETFEIYLRYHFSICERPELVGATHHMLDIFSKLA